MVEPAVGLGRFPRSKAAWWTMLVWCLGAFDKADMDQEIKANTLRKPL